MMKMLEIFMVTALVIPVVVLTFDALADGGIDV
jgi:hypothetical protein